MSHEWIDRNIGRAVPRDIAIRFQMRLPDGSRPYNRHMFYIPPYIDSLLTHLGATFEGGAAELHDKHSAIHYSEDDVEVAVSRAKLRERNTGKYPGAKGLRDEK